MRFPCLLFLAVVATTVQLCPADRTSRRPQQQEDKGGGGDDGGAILGIFNMEGNPFESVPEMERRFKKWVNSGVKLALPYLMSIVTDADLSPECTRGLLKLMRGVMDIRDWAVRMLDALGKPPAGILDGTGMALGDYDECLDVFAGLSADEKKRNRRKKKKDDEELGGQYCMVQINLPEAIRKDAIDYQSGNKSSSLLANSKTFLSSVVKIAPFANIADLRLGVCVPSTCSVQDLQAIINEITRVVKIEARTLRCETKQPIKLTTDQTVILTVFGLIFLMVALGTAYDTLLRLTNHREAFTYDQKKTKLSFLLEFSVRRNLEKLFATEQSHDIGCIHGLKFITACLYVVIATYASPEEFHFLKYRSAFHFYKFFDEWWFTVFANSPSAVDTIFFVAGLQITYSTWKKYSTGNNKIKINGLRFLGMWFTRLALLQLLVIALLLCLPIIGRGPIWADVVTPEVEKCRSKWWMNALFLNNFFPSQETCMWHTWIVTDLMQLFILMPVLLYILSRWPTFGILFIVVLMLGSSAAVAIVTVINELPPSPAFYFISFLNLGVIWDKLFIQAYNHVSPFCVGVFLGYLFAKNWKIRLSKTAVASGWILMALCNFSILCSLYWFRNGNSMGSAFTAIYAAVHGLAWSLGMAWIVFACHSGYGGVVNSILSWKILVPLDRLSCLVYLLSPLVFHLHTGQLREKMYMQHIDQVMYATAYMVLTVALAAVCYVVFCSPFTAFESKIWNVISNDETSVVTACIESGKKTSKIAEKLKNQVTKCDMVPMNFIVETKQKEQTKKTEKMADGP